MLTCSMCWWRLRWGTALLKLAAYASKRESALLSLNWVADRYVGTQGARHAPPVANMGAVMVQC